MKAQTEEHPTATTLKRDIAKIKDGKLTQAVFKEYPTEFQHLATSENLTADYNVLAEALLLPKWDAIETPQARWLSFSGLLDLPSYEWLIEGVLPARGLGLLYAPSNVGKSLVALHMSLQLCNDGKKIAYVATEGLYSLSGRILASIKTNGWNADKIESNMTFRQRPSPQLLEHDMQILIDDLTEFKPDLIIFDIFGDMMDGDENFKGDVKDALDTANLVIDSLNCMVLMVHHSGWNKDHHRGSSYLRDKAETIIRINASENQPEYLWMQCEKQREAAKFDTKTFKKITGELCGISLQESNDVIAEPILTPAKQAVYDQVLAHPDSATSEIAEATRLSPSGVGGILKEFINRGVMIKRKDGRFMRYKIDDNTAT